MALDAESRALIPISLVEIKVTAGAPGGGGAPANPGPCLGCLGRPGMEREAPTMAVAGEVARAGMQAGGTGGRKVKSV